MYEKNRKQNFVTFPEVSTEKVIPESTIELFRFQYGEGARALWEREATGSGSLEVVSSESAAGFGGLRGLGRLRGLVARLCLCA